MIVTPDILLRNSTLKIQQADDVTQLEPHIKGKVKAIIKIHGNSQRNQIALRQRGVHGREDIWIEEKKH